MTKAEAITAMEEGHKVTHEYFDRGEWICLIPGDMYQYEDGVIFSSLDFWEFKPGSGWNTGWSIFK